AKSRQVFSSTSSYSSIFVLNKADWAHHLQFSEHLPERAFIIGQVSNRRPTRLSLISPAARYKACLSTALLNKIASSRVICPPFNTFSFNCVIILLFIQNKKGMLTAHPFLIYFNITFRPGHTSPSCKQTPSISRFNCSAI